ncbi:MAG: methyltransferase domain-containing protein [Nanoarchaeota archaeon]|nr:methyltransferase domain-containing protein [DPANN group archaeon]MBL7116220.1 methyltransferase domain-containing protein [Nanoarchaeota archaeon]
MKSETEKTRKKYDRVSRFYDLMEGMMESGLTKHKKKLLSKVKGDVLEIGVGTGRNLGYYNNKANVTGIDLSPKMLSRAIKKAKLAKRNYSLLVMDAENLKFKDESFDYIVCIGVLCSIPNPVKALDEMRRVLKPKGEILMLEHMLSDNKLIYFLENIFNPITKGFFGFNINRDTLSNIKKAHLRICEKDNIAMHDVFKKLVVAK